MRAYNLLPICKLRIGIFARVFGGLASGNFGGATEPARQLTASAA
jgi:hypothetical protein